LQYTGGWGKGFVLAISKRWPAAEEAYRAWHRAQADFNLGITQFVQVQPDTWIANMIGQHSIKSEDNPIPIRYDALEKCLTQTAQKAIQLCASVHMPRIGCGLSGGKWEKIEPLIIRELSKKNIPVFVYDFEN
jgi:O-acetyl-ADP-ribose deacetylase (regulator of RNase III)